jgi:phosphatidylinositol glycan class O
VIWQLKHNNKSMVFAGDDTWTQLFPDSFIREYPRDSFNVNDLNTVDDAVIECFNDNIGKRDWDVLIGTLDATPLRSRTRSRSRRAYL